MLCTGADGFIGGALTSRLKEMGGNVRGTNLSLTENIVNPTVVNYLFEATQPTAVFHLAAHAIVGKAEAETRGCFETNIMGTVNILEACRKWDCVEALVVASSDKAYGRSPPPYKEDITPLDASNPYDTSKACADMVARCYASTYGLPVTATRCSNVYGPGDLNWSRLIPYLARCLILGEMPLLHAGRGHVSKEWTYVDDVVDAYVLLAEKIGEAKGKAYNVGSGEVFTRDMILRKMEEAAGRLTGFAEEEAKFKQIDSQALDSGRIRALGWTPKVDFKEGLRRSLEWYKEYLSS